MFVIKLPRKRPYINAQKPDHVPLEKNLTLFLSMARDDIFSCAYEAPGIEAASMIIETMLQKTQKTKITRKVNCE